VSGSTIVPDIAVRLTPRVNVAVLGAMSMLADWLLTAHSRDCHADDRTLIWQRGIGDLPSHQSRDPPQPPDDLRG